MTLECASSFDAVTDPPVSRWHLIRRFALAGASIGFCVGVLEAGLLYFIPRATGLIHPDVQYVIWFLAPMVDLVAGALLGLILGVLASLRKCSAASVIIFSALGIGLVGAYVAWLLDWFRIGAGVIFPRRLDPITAMEAFLIILAIALFLLTILRRRRFFRRAAASSRSRWLAVNLVILAALIAGVCFYATHRPFSKSSDQEMGMNQHDAVLPGLAKPNIALIVLDTVRADHFSCYGYSRPTTPNICALAARGVLFENVVAPSSWTLPSITSIFTGLLPHQTGANWGRAPGAAPWTLARILRSKGYETAGFNANPFYGLSGWRLGEGFSVYEDASDSLRHNLAVTFVGQSVVRYLYDHLVRYNQFDHEDAADVNREVERWAGHRDTSRPYFLFINYMDAHRPYLPPATFDHRFGIIPANLLARVSEPLNGGHPRKPYAAAERADLIDGYDNSLAYLDEQVGRLVEFLRRQPGGAGTIFIVTSDHGEGFGEHGTYDHGWNLYREVLHVPLIIAGPGIPPAKQITTLVPSRDLFSTILDLSLGLTGAVEQTSLRKDWTAIGPSAQTAAASVVSEIDVFSRGTDPAAISLSTLDWRLILNSDGGAELYSEQKDPDEKKNLAGEASLRDTLAGLRAELEARLAYSLLPWRATDYLAPLNQPGASFVEQVTSGRVPPTAARIPIGSAQAVFSHYPPSQLIRPTPSQQETLRTLPYH